MNYLVLSVGVLRGKRHFWGGLKCWSLGEGWRTFCDPQADIVGLQMENHVNCFQELDLGKYNIAKFQVIIASVLFFLSPLPYPYQLFNSISLLPPQFKPNEFPLTYI